MGETEGLIPRRNGDDCTYYYGMGVAKLKAWARRFSWHGLNANERMTGVTTK